MSDWIEIPTYRGAAGGRMSSEEGEERRKCVQIWLSGLWEAGEAPDGICSEQLRIRGTWNYFDSRDSSAKPNVLPMPT